jgi:hypothetical protein
MEAKNNVISEIGPTKAANRAKKKDLETYGHDVSPGDVKGGVKRATNAMSKTKRDKSGAIARASYRQHRAMEQLVVEGWTKLQNKAKKNAVTDKAGGGDRSYGRWKSKIYGSGTKKGDEHTYMDAAAASRRMGDKKDAKKWLDKSKNSRLNLESIVIERFATMLVESRGPNAYKRSEIKANMNKEEPGTGSRYIMQAAAKRSKDATVTKNVNQRDKAKADVSNIADKLGAEKRVKPGSEGEGKITKGAFRKAVTGSPSTGKFTKGGLKPGNPGEDGRLNPPAKQITNKPEGKSSGYGKTGTSQPPMSIDKINRSGVGGKSGEAASQAKFNKLDKVPAFDKQAAQRKMFANKIAAMRKK